MRKDLERIIEFEPAYDKRSADQNKNYGIHGVDMRWVLRGDKGVVQFVMFTNWHLPHVRAYLDSWQDGADWPIAADLGYHSPEPLYDGQSVQSQNCQYLDGKPCYCDGSGLAAEIVYDLLVTEGHEAAWSYLEQCYDNMFEDPTK